MRLVLLLSGVPLAPPFASPIAQPVAPSHERRLPLWRLAFRQITPGALALRLSVLLLAGGRS
jgi:hypothetical protein